jgi:hypothetical protein
LSGWSPADHVINGVFAQRDDLLAATAQLSELTKSRVIVATFSAYYLLPSASCAHSDDAIWSSATIDRLHAELQLRLRDEEDQTGFVAKQVIDILRASGATSPRVLIFGGHLERSGRLAVIVAADQTLQAEDASAQAALCAACALGSRPAAFSRDNSIEQSVLRKPLPPPPDGPQPLLSPGDRSSTPERLMAFAREALGASAVVGYEVRARGSIELQRHAKALTIPQPEWIPDNITLTPDLEIPPAPEVGGSRFQSLGELVAVCADKNRRLVGTVAGTNRAFGLPYGFDPIREGPAGVLCMVWGSEDERRIGVYEMAVSRMVALHLARNYDERRWEDSVQMVTSQLGYISALPTSPAPEPLVACATELEGRRDVGLVAASVSHILHGLVELSGAMSATCRLIAGADGLPLSRHLLRLHCEGQACAADSPAIISLASASESVNAWVAVHGRRVHLRALDWDEVTGHWTSPDLHKYPGLERVSIYREQARAELCVPIFAERRIVGTVNLEATRQGAFNTTAQIVSEYAQLIGIALLEARRRIGVDTVTEAGGFLDHRHLLEAKLMAFDEVIKKQKNVSEYMRRKYRAKVKQLQEVVFMRRVASDAGLSERTNVGEVLHAAMKSVGWADTDTDLNKLLLNKRESSLILPAQLSREPAAALKFAIGQALHNVRKHGGSGGGIVGRERLAMFRLAEQKVGGELNLYIAVSSTCLGEKIAQLDPQRVFREPIEHAGNERISLGAYLAGESVRRCGGSAYLRVNPRPGGMAIVEAEFSVPALVA